MRTESLVEPGRTSQRPRHWIATAELVAVALTLLLVLGRRLLEITVLEVAEQNGADVAGLERTRPHPLQFDLSVTAVLIGAGICAVWTWRRARLPQEQWGPWLSRTIVGRRVIVCLTLALVASSLMAWASP